MRLLVCLQVHLLVRKALVQIAQTDVKSSFSDAFIASVKEGIFPLVYPCTVEPRNNELKSSEKSHNTEFCLSPVTLSATEFTIPWRTIIRHGGCRLCVCLSVCPGANFARG